jgi:hypothetical protein
VEVRIRRQLRYIYIFLGALLILVSAIATTESASITGPAQPVDSAFFGMHIHHATTGTGWPAVPFASWRLWDAGVAWPQVEPARGRWDFTELDRYTRLANEHHVEILLTLGLTPAWASSRPQEVSAYSNGNAAEPGQLSDWEEYVRTVATRYKGVIHNYEIWNEPNEKGTFTGSVSEMAELSRVAYQTLKTVDSTITVVSPSATTGSGVPWLDQFLQQGGCQYSDVIGYHFYVTPEPPERMISLIQAVEATIRKHNCAKKSLWNTESGWAKPKLFKSDEEAGSYLMRSLVLNRLLGVQRFYWYAWDNHNWSTLDLTSAADSSMTNAGAAYGVIHNWLLGAVLRSCKRDRAGVWICQLERAGATSRMMWSDGETELFTPPSGWQVQQIVDWTGRASRPPAAIKVGPTPLLLESD